jgi:hypothetical protein
MGRKRCRPLKRLENPMLRINFRGAIWKTWANKFLTNSINDHQAPERSEGRNGLLSTLSAPKSMANAVNTTHHDYVPHSSDLYHDQQPCPFEHLTCERETEKPAQRTKVVAVEAEPEKLYGP